MTTDPHERAKLMTISGFMAIACNFCLCWSYAATQLPIFHGTVNGARWVGSAMGVGIMVFGLSSAFLCGGERPVPRSTLGEGEPGVHLGLGDFWLAVKRVAGCRPFALLAGAYAIIQVGLIGVDLGLLPYIIIFYVCGGDQAHGAIILGAAATAWLTAALLVTAPVLWISQRIGKKETLLLFLSVTFVGSSLRWLFYNPAHPYWVVVPFGLYGCGTGAFFLLAPSMTADTSDLEESISGVRNSGMFSALFSWTGKLGTTLGTLGTGLLITVTGFTAGSAGLAPQTIINMKVLDTVVPTVGIAVGIIMILRYPLTASRMKSVRQVLIRNRTESGTESLNERVVA